jgi:UDP-sugar diphosphatase
MNSVNWTAVAVEHGLTLELCAGLCDKTDLTPAQVMAEEVYEECGYRIEAARLQYVTSYW